MNYFENILKDRKDTYEIELELQVRKLFESMTEYIFEFQKNEDIYGYDLSVFKYVLEAGGRFKKQLIAFIEIEISEKWIDVYPDYWQDYSFLMRKVYDYDFKKNEFTNNVKANANTCIYIIFNKSLTDCICQKVDYIAGLEKKYRKLTGKDYTDWFLTTKKTDTNIVKGIDKAFQFCYSFIKSC